MIPEKSNSSYKETQNKIYRNYEKYIFDLSWNLQKEEDWVIDNEGDNGRKEYIGCKKLYFIKITKEKSEASQFVIR